LYVPITITNSQSTATPAPFQQMITFNPSSYVQYESSNLGNIRFFQGSTELYSWCESGCSSTSSQAVFWVKLPSGIGANSGTTIEMVFEPTSINYDGVYAGEAPQLSSTYAQYDDGASVFNNYWNFAGTSLSSSWTAISGTAGTDYKINNGLQLLTTTARLQGSNLYQNFILEGYFQFISDASSGGWDFGVFSSTSSAYGLHADGNGGSGWASTWYYNNGYTEISTSGATIGSGYYFLWQLINNAGSITTNFDTPAYSKLFTASFTNSLSGAPITVGERFDNTHTGQAMNVIFYYIRTRAYPPNGVMPSYSFGGASS
ncbi:MAG: hypothetical protein ACP5MB_11400, partial [bacterium]